MKQPFIKIGAVISSLAMSGAYIGTQCRQQPPKHRPLEFSESFDGVAIRDKPREPEVRVPRIDPALMPSTKMMVLKMDEILRPEPDLPFYRRPTYAPSEEQLKASKE